MQFGRNRQSCIAIFRIQLSDAASNGTAAIDTASDAWSYTPDANFNGTDAVTVTDDLGGTTTQQIDLTITLAPTPSPAPTPTPEPKPSPTNELPADVSDLNADDISTLKVMPLVS